MRITLIRYWGSHLKRPDHGGLFAEVFARAAVKGWKTCLVCSHPPDDRGWLSPLLDVGTRIEYLPRPRGNFDARCVQRVFNLCRRLRCGVFHCDNMHTSPLVGSALAGVPVRLWSKRSMEPAFEAGRTPSIRDRLVVSVRLSCCLATRTLAVSRAVKDQLVRMRIPATKLVVFPNPVNVERAGKPDRDEARTQLGYNSRELVIATVGHAVPVKGWDILLESFGRIASNVPDARLLFVGSATGADERDFANGLKRRAEQLGLAERVRFAGHVQDVFVPLAASDIFVFPSRSEGNSNALLEALAVGLPCVATQVGAAPDIIRHGYNGFLVDREDGAALADLMLALARDSDLREQVSRSARSTGVAPSPEEYAERLVSLYESLLTRADRWSPPRRRRRVQGP